MMIKNTLLFLLAGGWILSACSLPGFTQKADQASQSLGEEATPSLPTIAIPEMATLEPQETLPPEYETPYAPLSYSASNCTYGGEFKTIEALDENTVQFELCYPDVAFLTKIAFPSFGILPGEWLEKTGGGGKGSPLLVEPIGSGPYRIDGWLPGEEIRFSAFEDYWGENKAKIPNLVFRWNIDDSQRLLELQTGTVQGIDSPNPEDYTAIQADPGLDWVNRQPLSVAFLGMNNTYPPLDNQLVRQAIALALDRQPIVERFFPVGFEVANFFTPCAVPNGCVGDPWYEYDPKKAGELLAEAGYPDGFQTQISFRNVIRGYITQPDLVAREIRDQLKKNLNISAQLIAIDSPEFLQAADDGLLPGLFLLGWGADYPDVSNFLDTHFGERATKLLGNPFNDIYNPLRSGSATADEQTRLPFYEQANNAIRQHVPLVPLAHGGWVEPQSLAAAFNMQTQGTYANPLGLERFADLALPGKNEFVWMQSFEPLSLYCADETDVSSLRACAQIIEPLYQFEDNSARPKPSLAEACLPNGDLTVWTCRLRQAVRFHDGSGLDANDVVQSFLVQWDAAHPLHKGRTGEFAYFKDYWGEFLNVPVP